MKQSQNDKSLFLDESGMMSTEFLEQSGLKVRLLAGAPTMLELGLVSSAFAFQERAKFELFEDNGLLTDSYEAFPTVLELIRAAHKKFAKAMIVRSLANSKMVFFDYSNDYFLFLAKDETLKYIFHLNLDQMSAYFEDTLEGDHSKAYLRSIWAKYEPFM